MTTDAFRRIMAQAPSIDDLLCRLSRLTPDDREAIRALSAEIRRTLEAITIPDDLAAAITRPLARLGEQAAYTNPSWTPLFVAIKGLVTEVGS